MSIKRNFIFSAALTLANYLFPFIVYPYVSRVLGPTNIGICNYVDGIIDYAMLFSLMGISIIGVRSIAKANGNRQERNRAFTALFIITAAFTVVSTIALVSVTFLVDALQSYRPLLLIGIIKLWGNFFLIDWLYKGLEDFRYITMRTILVKLFYMVAIFIFIHKAQDYVTYYLLMCLTVAGNAAFNCARAARLVSFKFDWSVVVSAIKPTLILGMYLFLTSMYTTFNVLYLRSAWCGPDPEAEVGYFTTATKIFKLVLAFYTAYSVVVMPRASSLLAKGQMNEFRKIIRNSIQALMIFSIPLAIFCMMFSPGLVGLIAGPQFGPAVVPMVLVMPLLFIIGYEQILVVQILTPMSNDKVILLNSIIGATISIVCNLALVGAWGLNLGAVGSAIVWLVSEISVLIVAQSFVKKYTNIRFPACDLLKHVAHYLPFAALGALLYLVPGISEIGRACLGGVILVAYFFIAQHLWIKSPIFIDLWEQGITYIQRFHNRTKN